ncbi:MAG TPA: hypothetical protein VGM06_16060 [Polyangiaceae bacterium]
MGEPKSIAIGLLLAGCSFGALAACTSSSADQVTKPVALGIMGSMAPSATDGDIMLFESQIPVPLPVRAMTAADVQAAGAAPAGTPYPRGVFLQATDESVELHFTLSNVDTDAHNVWLLIDPWNEFVRWKPGETVTEEDIIPNFGYDLYFTIPGKQRVVGTITSDDMHEIAIKLASVEQLLASPQAQDEIAAEAAGTMTMTGDTFDATSIANNIFNPQNRSNATPPDPLYTPWIPPVIPGITGFDLGLRTSESANVAVEITMEVQDLRGDRFVAQDSNAAELGVPPVTLSPPNANF